MNKVKIIEVNESNVDEMGFFCNMSRRKSEGYQRKLKWLKKRFDEGLKIKMILPPEGRGFIEYIPGEYAWRAVNAKGYMFIHCLWVVGKSKGKGLGKLLLTECLKDAKKSKMLGVAMVTSERPWLVEKSFLHKCGFEPVDKAPPAFELMVKKFKDATSPSFAGDWDKKMKGYGQGFAIFRSDQCPYLDDAVKIVQEAARKLGIKSRVIELKSAQEVRKLAPSAYGVFSIVYKQKLLSYFYLTKNQLLKLLKREWAHT